jgi:virulence-associated protein VagC
MTLLQFSSTDDPQEALAKIATAMLDRQAGHVSVDDNPEYQKFRLTYQHDPVAFVHDCIVWKNNWKPAVFQDEILNDLETTPRVSARAPHGVGKTALMAWAILWFALTNDGMTDWKIPVTASAWRQLTKFAFPELHKWAHMLDWAKIGRKPFDERLELKDLSLRLSTGECFALASDNAALIEGAHASRLLYIFDESKEIPVPTWDSAEGAFSTGDCRWLAVSTPGEPSGRFYDIQSRQAGFDQWTVRHVTLAEAIQAGRVRPEWAENCRMQWGEQSAVYQNRVLGEFASSEADGIIPLSWVELANGLWNEWHDSGSPAPAFTCVGVDVARSGDDKTVLALRYDWLLHELRKHTKEDTMETTGRVAGILHAHPEGYASVDVIGIGAGVVDRLHEMGYNVHSFNAAEHTDAMDSTNELAFANVRSAAWWNMRELLDPANGNHVALPEDTLLTGDLVSVHWKIQSGGKIIIEPKEDIKERIGRSTDCGDAVVQAFYDNRQPSDNEWIDAMKKRIHKQE